jgi:thioredoxin 1
MAKVIASTAEFDKLIKDAENKLVVIDFTASWCPPCKMIAPVFDQLARTYEGKAHLVKVDVDQHNAIAQRYAVRAMPTFVFVRKGGVLDTLRGANTGKLKEMVARYIDKGTAPAGGFPGSGNSLAGGSGSAPASSGGSLLGAIPRENLLPFGIILVYLAYVIYNNTTKA